MTPTAPPVMVNAGGGLRSGANRVWSNCQCVFPNRRKSRGACDAWVKVSVSADCANFNSGSSNTEYGDGISKYDPDSALQTDCQLAPTVGSVARSEERRVGKE